MKNWKKFILPASAAGLVIILALLAVFVFPWRQADKAINLVDSSELRFNPIAGLSSDFIMGADVSMLHEIELNGGKFFVNGVEEDCLQILKDHGVNWIRLRVWVNPVDAKGNPLGGGNNDLATTVELAARAKKLGLKVLIDLHYSDWWADPDSQEKPAEWAALSGDALEQAVYDYTANVIHTLVKAHAAPDMVQVGNEINGGMLWPDGKIWQEGSEEIGGFEGLAGLLNQGVQAVQDNDPNAKNEEKRIKIMIHLANGGNNDLYRTMFDGLTEQGVQYDVIGLSYYSYWHGPIEDLISNMNDISARYNKPVVIAETAYPYTLEAGDSHDNLVGDGFQEQGGYEATLQGQVSAMHDVMAAVAQVPEGKGLGIFYWEPDWIPVEGAGWQTGAGNAWENQAMFSFTGSALPSLNVFRLVRPEEGGVVVEPQVLELLPLTAKVPLDGVVVPPAYVLAKMDDDSIKKLPVTWDPIDPEITRNPGKETLTGTIDGSTLQVVMELTVDYTRNYASNGDFETGDLTNWSVTGDSNAVNISNEKQNVHQGDYAMHYWLGDPYQFTATQTVNNLADGTYAFSLWIHGGGGEKQLKLITQNCGGEDLTVDVVNTGWQKWSNPTIRGIQVTGGSCTIGFSLDSDAGTWAFIDEVVFYPDTGS